MAEFSELIKRLNRVRSLVRDFYLFGYRTRGEYGGKSGRSYDDDRRRIESWLGPLVRRGRSSSGSNVFISVDVAGQSRNPLYAVWKTKSFTRNDILLHFLVLDLLADGLCRSAEELADGLAERYGEFFDARTVRLKLQEYQNEGLLVAEKKGRKLLYSLSKPRFAELAETVADGRLLAALDFFTEMAPFGEVGSILQDEIGHVNERLCFKHHFIVHTLEDEVLLKLLEAMDRKYEISLTMRGGRVHFGVPVKIFTGLQSGRRYVCMSERERYAPRRLDRVENVELGEPAPDFDERRRRLESMLPKAWGVGLTPPAERLEMRLAVDECREGYVLERLQREGRGGKVLREGENVFLYTRDVWDPNEMLPFIKSFTGRILSVRCSYRMVSRKFRRDAERMAEIYGVVPPTENAGEAMR